MAVEGEDLTAAPAPAPAPPGPGPFSGAVLTGGRSTRMGTDKAMAVVGGQPLALRPYRALRGAGAAEVLAVGGDLEALAALGFAPVDDPRPGQGPLAGVVRALEAAAGDVVVVLACDTPFVTPAVVRALVAGLGDAEVAVARAGGRLQPLLAAWSRRALPALHRCFRAGERSVHRAMAGLEARVVVVDDERVARNVNTPADLAAAGDEDAAGP